LDRAECRLFPAIVDPKPIGRVAKHCLLERLIDLKHNRPGRARLAAFASGDLRTRFDPPPRKADPITNTGTQRAIIAESKDCGRWGSRAVVAQERQSQPVWSGVLV